MTNMKIFSGLLVSVGATIFPVSAHAVVVSDITLGGVGTEINGTQITVGITPNTYACKYGGVYFTTANQVNQVLSVALTAKTTARKVTIALDVDSTGVCKGSAIYIQ